MDGNIVQLDAFKRRGEEVEQSSADDKYNYIQGKATCLACRHDWQVVADVGTTSFHCPECNLDKGVINQILAPETYWQCGTCHNEFFMVSPDGCVCTCCGTLQTF